MNDGVEVVMGDKGGKKDDQKGQRREGGGGRTGVPYIKVKSQSRK